MNWISLTVKYLQYILAKKSFAKNSMIDHLTCGNFTPASSDIDFAYLGTVVGRHMIHAGTTTVTHDLSKGGPTNQARPIRTSARIKGRNLRDIPCILGHELNAITF